MSLINLEIDRLAINDISLFISFDSFDKSFFIFLDIVNSNLAIIIKYLTHYIKFIIIEVVGYKYLYISISLHSLVLRKLMKKERKDGRRKTN